MPGRILAARHPLLEQACKQELSFVLTYDVEGLLIGGITTQLWLMVDAVMAIGGLPNMFLHVLLSEDHVGVRQWSVS